MSNDFDSFDVLFYFNIQAAFFCINRKMKEIQVLLFLVFVNIINCAKFSPGPRILMPVFENLSVNFTLQVIEGGCFTW